MDYLSTVIRKYLDADIQYIDYDNVKKKPLCEIQPQASNKIDDIQKLPLIDINKAISNLRNDNVLLNKY